jgi:hypothetical protein
VNVSARKAERGLKLEPASCHGEGEQEMKYTPEPPKRVPRSEELSER